MRTTSLRLLTVLVLAVVATPVAAKDELTPAVPVANALPFTVDLVPVTYNALVQPPQLHAYSFASLPQGRILALGGRISRGLHSFSNPEGQNFPGPNSTIWAISFTDGVQGQFDVNALPPKLATALQSTNQQGYYDSEKDLYYVAGGYGKGIDGNQVSHDTLIRFPAEKLYEIISGTGSDVSKAKQINPLIELTTDPMFKVTGGELERLGDTFFLVFGQRFDGNYLPFQGTANQEYTEAIRMFTLNPGSLKVLSKGALKSNDPDDPFHRRDGNIFPSVDPMGKPRITALGGVFPPGEIAGYLEPIQIDSEGYRIDRSFQQLLCQYTCPTLVVHAAQQQTVYYTLFGGVGHFFYHLRHDKAQWKVYEQVSAEGRNDGLPFTSDITTLVEHSDGTWEQWILPHPMPFVPNPGSSAQGEEPPPPARTNLIGASTHFIPNRDAVAQGVLTADGVVHLEKLSATEPTLVGWMYGGIRADYPLPVAPSYGTSATDAVFQVTITRTPSAALPSSAAIPAVATDPRAMGARSKVLRGLAK